MPLQETSGAASYDAFGGGVPVERVYIEQIFSTYLYTGTGATQTITNGIDLAGEGGLIWGKHRAFAVDPVLYDTERGINQRIQSSTTQAETTRANTITSFNSDGVTLGTGIDLNESGRNIALWTFRKQPKFFDIVTYTGDGTSDRQIAHLLGSTPGCVIIKETSGAKNWGVWHRSFSSVGDHIYLNTTGAVVNNTVAFGPNLPTSSVFNVGAFLNTNGATYVAYLFAHDAGGFGLTGTDNVISCGSYVGNGSTTAAGAVDINLGWEPQWILVKSATSTGGDANWSVLDTMRGYGAINSTGNKALYANTSGAEQSNDFYGYTTSTGFKMWETNVANNGTTYIYIAIRRGPMKVPTSGTEVYTNTAYAGNSSTQTLTAFGFPPDLSILKSRNQGYEANVYDRLRGSTRQLVTPYTREELTQSAGVTSFDQNGITMGSLSSINTSAQMIGWSFRRAPGFFDEVCYTGTGVARTVAHNLAAVPEMMIVKKRSSASTTGWFVYQKDLLATQVLFLNTISQVNGGFGVAWNSTRPTASVFSVGTSDDVNQSAETYVNYLFATVAGVSKVGSYTGTGTTQVINCGFTAGARFVLIKRTDDTGDWYVWDSARGIVAGNDPYLLLNSTAAEVTSTDYVDTASTGFEISSTAPAAINANGGSFIFFAVA